MSAGQVHWPPSQSTSMRNFITIPANWVFPGICLLVYKYDAPQAKLCHFDINPLDIPMYQVNSLEEDIWSPQTMSNDFSVCDIRRLSLFIPPN